MSISAHMHCLLKTDKCFLKLVVEKAIKTLLRELHRPFLHGTIMALEFSFKVPEQVFLFVWLFKKNADDRFVSKKSWLF